MTRHDVWGGETTSGSLCASAVRHSLTEIEHLAACGWRLFPCKSADKTPLVKWKSQATSDPATVLSWRERYPGCNWAVACGPDSGLWVLDVDGAEGAATLHALCREYGDACLNTLTAVTARGRHYYFTYPTHCVIRNTVRQLGPGLDTRAAGGYVIVPPSVHPSGHQYRWVDPDLPIAAPPHWLCEMASSKKKREVAPAAQIGILSEGRRNDGLIRLAGAMRRKGKTQWEIVAGLLEANQRRCRPPLEDAEIRKIAASAARYEIGGPDPLEAAWEAIRECAFLSHYERLLALAWQLQLARPGQTIALPLERVAALFGCHFNLISRLRRQAIEEGRLTLVESHIPHRRAAVFTFNELTVEVGRVELNHISSGLVTHPSSPLVTPQQQICPTYTSPHTERTEKRTDSLMIEGRI